MTSSLLVAPLRGDKSSGAQPPSVIGQYWYQCTVLPVTICDHVVMGAGAVITKDIVQAGIYAGNPARFLTATELMLTTLHDVR